MDAQDRAPSRAALVSRLALLAAVFASCGEPGEDDIDRLCAPARRTREAPSPATDADARLAELLDRYRR